ncbi:SUZ domain-containing protein 1 [Agrilus planipennis]|uniref:SUZ RNA-binding domain-containing n=1 Tax=Agrilus planipennis TaxID=224129 RepID=A0A1W4WPI5_AGRPL|nr:SUZ domain-containing protein 1 [Agrilus planipennis]
MASKQLELDVLENWEEIDETDVLEQKLRNLLPPNNELQNRSFKCNGNANGTTAIRITLTGEDALRSQYVPPEPTVKILKRPSEGTHVQNDFKIVQPKKTLQQREQEYAEARLRILGEARMSDKTEEKVSTIQIKPSRSNELPNVIRLPKGPDGTKGFKIRR